MELRPGLRQPDQAPAEGNAAGCALWTGTPRLRGTQGGRAGRTPQGHCVDSAGPDLIREEIEERFVRFGITN